MNNNDLIAQAASLAEKAKLATAGPWERRDTLIGPSQYHASTEIVGRVMHGSSTPVCRLSAGFVWFEGDCDFIAAARSFPFAAVAAELESLRKRVADESQWREGLAKIYEVNEAFHWRLVDLFDPEMRGVSPLHFVEEQIVALRKRVAELTYERDCALCKVDMLTKSVTYEPPRDAAGGFVQHLTIKNDAETQGKIETAYEEMARKRVAELEGEKS